PASPATTRMPPRPARSASSASRPRPSSRERPTSRVSTPGSPRCGRPSPPEPPLSAGHPPLRPPLGRDAGNRPRSDRLALPLQLELPGLAPFEQTFDRAVGGLIDQHGTGLGVGLEAGCDVDGVAECGVLDPRAGADLAHHHRAGRRTDADPEALGAPAALNLA